MGLEEVCRSFYKNAKDWMPRLKRQTALWVNSCGQVQFRTRHFLVLNTYY